VDAQIAPKVIDESDLDAQYGGKIYPSFDIAKIEKEVPFYIDIRVGS
jgi:hypothetical protein